MTKLSIRVLILLMVLSMALPIVSQAQDDGDGLSEEEIALIDRIVGIDALVDEYSSYAVNSFESETTTINYGGETFFSAGQLIRDGYVLNDGETENVAYHGVLTYTEDAAYAIEGDVLRVDDVVYVNAAYTESEDGAEPLVEGWQTIATVEEISLALEEFGLDDMFDDEEETALLTDKEALVEHASSVTLAEQVETEIDGKTVLLEQITLLVEGEDFLPFYLSILDEDAQTNPIIQVIFSEGLTGYMSVVALFDEDGDIYLVQADIEMDHLGVDAFAVLPDVFNEGETVDFEGAFSITRIYTDINGEFDPIEAPETE